MTVGELRAEVRRVLGSQPENLPIVVVRAGEARNIVSRRPSHLSIEVDDWPGGPMAVLVVTD